MTLRSQAKSTVELDVGDGEVLVARQHQDNLITGDLASRFYCTDVKIGVLEGGTSIGKEINKRGPILGDIFALESEADGEGEVLDRGKIL